MTDPRVPAAVTKTPAPRDSASYSSTAARAATVTDPRVPKRPRFDGTGFYSAASLLLDPSVEVKATPTAIPGFCSAASLPNASTEPIPGGPDFDPIVTANADDESFQINLTVLGWPYYKDQHVQKPSSGTEVLLIRESCNVFDANATAVHVVSDNKEAETKQIGHVARQSASLLAPLLDSNRIQISQMSIASVMERSFKIKVIGSSDGSQATSTVLDTLCPGNKVKAEPYSLAISRHQAERASNAPYKLDSLQALPWAPCPDWKQNQNKHDATLEHGLPAPFDESKFQKPPLSFQEIQASKNWPPSNDILLRLGLGRAEDENWWREVAGLRPPIGWRVHAGFDVTPQIKSLSSTNRGMAAMTLDGAIHGVTNVWQNSTLEQMKRAMEEPNFWCVRSKDSLIRAFGGPYILGQEEGILKLVHGAKHTELTAKICLAHNLVYTAVHLVPPASPGFNTLIFGCNLRGSGFHYHQDTIETLKPKNAPLVPRQPVVTTVFYQRPSDDSEKEVALWKPVLNWPVYGEYDAARAVPTSHGMIHVQRAGLQHSAKHGVFHTPLQEEGRKGYRVAITARIGKPNAREIVQEYIQKGSYCAEFGPEGDKQLHRA